MSDRWPHVVREAMRRYLAALEEHRDELNSLNVYPVPDGDTGTNLLLTQRVVVEALERAPDERAAEAVADGALMGARGNSGVILAQVLRGVVGELLAEGGADAAGGGVVARALERAEREARAAIARPVEGTALTVLSAAAGAARDAGATERPEAAEAALRAAAEALGRTTEMLPELRAAGVVDAGGLGIVLLLDALASVLSGREARMRVGPGGPVGRDAERTLPTRPIEHHQEVMYLWEGPDEEVPALREALQAIGESVVIVGGGGLRRVHVHVSDPAAALAAAGSRPTRDVRVVDLREQVEAMCAAGEARAVQEAADGSGLVAVVEGDGLRAIFSSLGATVVPGGPARNPSVGELLDAVEATPGEPLFVLPNDPNVVPAAELAAARASKRVVVVPTRSVPEGVAAATAFDRQAADPDELVEATRGVGSAALARAVRDAATPVGEVREGQWLASADGRTAAVADDAAAAALAAVRALRTEDHELLTLYVGADAPASETDAVVAAIRGAFPDLELRVHDGGQPLHPYLIGLE